MSKKSFKTARARATSKIEFELDDEQFEAHPSCAGEQLMAAVEIMSDEKVGIRQRIGGLLDFLDAVLKDDGGARIRERWAGKRDALDPRDLMDVVQWLVEEVYSDGRPTAASTASSDGRSTTGAGSTVPASPPALTPSALTPAAS